VTQLITAHNNKQKNALRRQTGGRPQVCASSTPLRGGL